MSTFNYKSSAVIAFLCLALLFSYANSAERRSAIEETCSNLSALWKGGCVNSGHCKQQCIEKEGADGGVCEGFRCWCHRKCVSLCDKPSGIWKGGCIYSSHCSDQCSEKENAVSGYCNWQFKCLCSYYNC